MSSPSTSSFSASIQGPLSELITFTDIGSEATQPKIAYPQCGSFVKFLIDTSGFEKFKRLYRSLENGSSESIVKRNRGAIQDIYARSLEQLEESWLAHLSTIPAVEIPNEVIEEVSAEYSRD